VRKKVYRLTLITKEGSGEEENLIKWFAKFPGVIIKPDLL
jgi:hypothetical protein